MSLAAVSIELDEIHANPVGSNLNINRDDIPKEDSDLLFQKVCNSDCYVSFKTLYQSYYNRVLFYAKKYVDSIETSEEVVSEVFLKLWNKRKHIHIQSSFQSYLFTAIRNRCLDMIRKEGSRHFESDDVLQTLTSTHSNTQEIIQSNELYEKIEAAINKLPKDRRRIFLMSRNEGLRYKEIAEKLGISIKTVETQMGRSLKFLRETFKEELSEFYS